MAISPGRVGIDLADDVLARRCGELAADGVDWLLVREKQLPEREIEALTRRILAEIAGSGMQVLVAAPPHVAVAAGAAGVHIGSDLTGIAEARRIFTEGRVSVSCHSVADVAHARTAGADLVLFGPVFGKTVDGVEVVPGMGLEALREACAVAGDSLPVFALGGVTAANAASCVDAGASGVAGIRLFFGHVGAE